MFPKNNDSFYCQVFQNKIILCPLCRFTLDSYDELVRLNYCVATLYLFMFHVVTRPLFLHGSSGDSNENKPVVGAEEEEVAKMGCPSLGEHKQLEVIIEESYEFKVT